ncbi:phosphatase PAP2 family protein [Streptomyces sp. NPDC056653]|uniref:phosphatase PAP2 family protein n=1 Tax=Streptomyces sp. NPDC056653 TaxID=3345894 RepID=UPI0036A5C775
MREPCPCLCSRHSQQPSPTSPVSSSSRSRTTSVHTGRSLLRRPHRAPCPPTDHWSFPGNHTGTAGATAAALAFPRPRTARCTVPPALLMAFSRVFAGVRLPHDVAVGLLAGGSVAAPVIVLLSRPARSLTLTARNQPGARRGPDTGPWNGRPSPRRARMKTPTEAHRGDRRVALSLHGPP